MLYRQLAHLLLVSALLWTAGGEAAARDIHVNNVGGNDRSSGMLQASAGGEGPVRTIDRALHLAQVGDRVLLANTGVPYRETMSLSAAQHCGSPGAPLVIEGNGAILDGSQPVPAARWENIGQGVFRFRPQRLGYQQLFIAGRPAPRVHLPGGQTRLPRLEPRQWCVIEGVIYFRVEPTKTPRDYDLTHAALSVGITLYHVHDVVISNLIVQGFQLDGINAHDGTHNCLLVDVVARGNARSGITVAGNSKLRVNAALIGDNGTVQVRSESLGVLTLVGCEVLDHTAPRAMQDGGRIIFADLPAEPLAEPAPLP